MYTINNEQFTRRMNILIYGDPGAGKTHLAGSAQDSPDMANVHFFNIDGGLLTLASRGDISATDIHSVEELEEELWKLASGDAKYAGIQTVVIDNITELQTLSLEGIAGAGVQSARRRNPRSDRTVDDIFLEDYGKSTKQMARILRGFRDLPLHKIYIAHRKDRTVGDSGVVEATVPSLTNKLETAVSGYMDFVWYLYTVTESRKGENGEESTELVRYLLTQNYQQYFAKTRGAEFAQALGASIRNPNMAEIHNIFRTLTESNS